MTNTGHYRLGSVGACASVLVACALLSLIGFALLLLPLRLVLPLITGLIMVILELASVVIIALLLPSILVVLLLLLLLLLLVVVVLLFLL